MGTAASDQPGLISYNADRAGICVGKPVFQPILQTRSGSIYVRSLHPQGDVAILLREMLGEGVLKDARITSKDLGKEATFRPRESQYVQKYPRGWVEGPREITGTRTYNTRVSVSVYVGGLGLNVSFEEAFSSVKCPPEELRARQIITVTGSAQLILKFTVQRLADICTMLSRRDTSQIQLYDDKPAEKQEEYVITLPRPVFQPYSRSARALCFGEYAAEGDVSILLSRLFGETAKIREFDWKPASRSSGGQGADKPLSLTSSEWNRVLDVPVEVEGGKLVASFEENQSSKESNVPPEEMRARHVIRITGNAGLVAKVREHPRLAEACAEFEARDIAAIRGKIESEKRRGGRPGRPTGVNPDQGWMRANPPKTNMAGGANVPHVKKVPAR